MLSSEMAMTERTFEILEHTADKGVAGTGGTLAEAFENTAYGMFSLFVDPSAYSPTGRRVLEIAADDLEQLLWSWLSELMFIFEVERELPLDFRITELTDTSLKSELSIRPIGKDIEWLGSGVKAVTYHQLKVERTGQVWRTQVYVDV
jgi:SHS2 domain-containing protein